jgi:hypothetical protein
VARSGAIGYPQQKSVWSAAKESKLFEREYEARLIRATDGKKSDIVGGRRHLNLIEVLFDDTGQFDK